MSLFVAGYGAMWERWDITAFVELFSEGVVSIDYQVEERVEGREALRRYIQKEAAEQGAVSVRMGGRWSMETMSWLSSGSLGPAERGRVRLLDAS
jgi:hypothetical protein